MKGLASSTRRSSTAPSVACRNQRSEQLLTMLMYKFLLTGESIDVISLHDDDVKEVDVLVQRLCLH